MLLIPHLALTQLHDNQKCKVIDYLELLIPFKIFNHNYTVDMNLPSLISLAIGGRTLITTLRFSFDPSFSFYFININVVFTFKHSFCKYIR